MKGLLLAIPLSGLCLMSSVTGKIIGGNKQRMKHMALTGLIVASSSLLLMAWLMSKPLWALLAAASAAGVGIGAALPCLDAFITEGIDKAQRGTVSAFYGSMRFVGVAAGPPFAAALSGRPSVLYTALAACVAAGVILIVICIRPRQALRLARPKAGLP